jgi:hypothetical protein
MQHDIVFKHDCNAMRITGKSTDSWWSGRTSNPAGVASNPWWVRLPRSSALSLDIVRPRDVFGTRMNGVPAKYFYGFESFEATSLALIPLSMRYRLDYCAIKLHLRQWQQFTLAERDDFVCAPFVSATDAQAWASRLTAVVQQRCGCPPDHLTDTGTPAWLQPDTLPADLVSRCAQLGLPLPALRIWQQLPSQQRHALYKTARSRHDFVHLQAALNEILPFDATHTGE